MLSVAFLILPKSGIVLNVMMYNNTQNENLHNAAFFIY